jgi:hypothetical protein
MEWKPRQPELQLPRFLVRAIPEKLEEPAQPAVRGSFLELKRPEAKKPPTVLMVFGRVAAGFLLAASLYFGVANFRVDRRLTARAEVSSPDTPITASAAVPARAPGNPGAKPAAKGPVGWVRRTVANRATLKFSEDFRAMNNWDGENHTQPAGWSRNPEGYTSTGDLAIFRPTVKFTDYRMEFFGQIENKSIDWTVRAKDTQNYHAMKLTVVEAGLRPFVALVHYDVVDGKPSHRSQTLLNVMVHNNRPMQFAVDVRGNTLVTSIDGEEVDSYFGNTLASGGVGFFSEAGESARLYWMRVARNDDWLGHVCAMFTDNVRDESASLRAPRLPGTTPTPGLPGDPESGTLAAVWFGLPWLGTGRRSRLFRTWRSDPWNTQAEAPQTARPCRQA